MAKVLLHTELQNSMIIPPDVTQELYQLINAAANSIKRKRALQDRFQKEGLTDSEAMSMALDEARMKASLLRMVEIVTQYLPGKYAKGGRNHAS